MSTTVVLAFIFGFGIGVILAIIINLACLNRLILKDADQYTRMYAAAIAHKRPLDEKDVHHE